MDDPATVPQLIPTTLRVASWNLWWRFGNWEERLPVVVERLRAVDPDVICLQEVWHDGTTSSAAVIADALGHEWRFAGDIELEAGVRFGNAVLSRWPITATDERYLPSGGDGDEHRLVLRADVEGPRGPLQVFCTHLNWRLDHSRIRQEQVRVLAQMVADATPRSYPPIVCGDFNAEPHSDEIEMLTGQRELAVDGMLLVDVWHACHPRDLGFTWTNTNPYARSQLEWDRRIDFIFAGWPKLGGAGVPVHCQLLGDTPTDDGIWPSDHLGLLADLSY
jgi:endonuclease/exonuclease/phosphatase family metal-dependent hydrolase